MKYTYINLYSRGAAKEYHVIWYYTDCFHHVMILLGDFQAHFGVIGSYGDGFRFEDIIYQFEFCQPRTMKALIKGKRYN